MAPRFCGHLWRAPNTRRSDDKSASRTGTLGGSDSTIPPSMRDEPAALVRRHLIFLDRASNGCLLVRSIVDDQLRGRTLDVVDGPGVALPARLPERLHAFSLGQLGRVRLFAIHVKL